MEGWYDKIVQHSQLRMLPIMLPKNKDVIGRSLGLNEKNDYPIRSIKYMARILKQIPLMIWVDKEKISEE